MHGNISRNGYGNAIIGRYGGCFEEGVWWVYGTGKNCVAQKRLAKWKDECAYIHGLTLVVKNSYTYFKSLLSPRSKVLLRMPLEG